MPLSESLAVPMSRPAQPELLSPAGDWDCLRAAVENGADAVYFGLRCGFNARARAANFELVELPEIIAFLHGRGVLGYVTMNTLVFTSELPEFERTVQAVAAAGADAILVQDLAAAWLARTICPELSIHASTQMTLTSSECIEVARQLGVERVVLARELSIDEITDISAATEMPLETFAHGALCVAYSGQCLTSESLGGRSANRGQCAQACRLPYELICDGRDVELGDVKYLLSPQDLAAYALAPELLQAGVCSLKIEGRLKSPEYVANITRHYRSAIDAAVEGRRRHFDKREVEEMELSFSRGFSPGWLNGCDHKMLAPGLSSSKRGVLLGEVVDVGDRRVAVRLQSTLSRGDGVVFDGDRASNSEQGGRVFEVRRGNERLERPVSKGVVELAFERNAIDFHQLYCGQALWKTDDPKLTARLRKTFSGPDPLRRTSLDLVVEAGVGSTIVIRGRTEAGAECRVESEEVLEEARKHALSESVLKQQLGRLGATPYALRDLRAKIDGRPMAPLSVLGKLRRKMIEQLDAASAAVPERTIVPGALAGLRSQLRPERGVGEPVLHVLCRSLQQLETALRTGVRSVMVDFQDIREYRAAVLAAHSVAAEIFLATPRIQKPKEMGIFAALAKHGADGVLARNLAGLRFFHEKQIPVVADFSLNAANELTVHVLEEFGASRVTASYDLNREQLLELLDASPTDRLEVVIHQHMPMFHMEHCVFCAVLSPGHNKTNCGRPCDVHQVQLRDRTGQEHPLHADVGCRNTLYNAVPQSSAEVVPALLKRGVVHFRIELLHDDEQLTRQTLSLYRDLIQDHIPGKEVWRRLNASNRVGVTRGTLEERRDPLAIL